MSWSDFYLFCFLFGTLFSLLSFMAGAVNLHLPFKMHFHLHLPHFHGGAHGGGHGGFRGVARGEGRGGGMHVSWFNASTVLAFLAWFGGIGYMLTKYSHVETFFIVAIATLAGLAAG